MKTKTKRAKKPGVHAYHVGQMVDVLNFDEKTFSVGERKNYITGKVIKITTRLHVQFPQMRGHMAYEAADCNQGRIRPTLAIAPTTKAKCDACNDPTVIGHTCEAPTVWMVTPRSEYSVHFERTVSMTYTTEVWARDEDEAVELAKKESDDNRWSEGHIVDEDKPRVRRLREEP